MPPQANSGEVSVDPEALIAKGKALSELPGEPNGLFAIMTKLYNRLNEIGQPWGDDKMGKQFSEGKDGYLSAEDNLLGNASTEKDAEGAVPVYGQLLVNYGKTLEEAGKAFGLGEDLFANWILNKYIDEDATGNPGPYTGKLSSDPNHSSNKPPPGPTGPPPPDSANSNSGGGGGDGRPDIDIPNTDGATGGPTTGSGGPNPGGNAPDLGAFQSKTGTDSTGSGVSNFQGPTGGVDSPLTIGGSDGSSGGTTDPSSLVPGALGPYAAQSVIDPKTGLTLDPKTGLPIDPKTGLPLGTGGSGRSNSNSPQSTSSPRVPFDPERVANGGTQQGSQTRAGVAGTPMMPGMPTGGMPATNTGGQAGDPKDKRRRRTTAPTADTEQPTESDPWTRAGWTPRER
ncbi:hypothetical protein [Nocardia sp. NPDC003979]